MRLALTIARHDLATMLRERETLMWLFFMPPLFFWFLGTVTGGGGGSDERDTIAVVVPADAGLLGERVLASLQSSQFDVVRSPDAAAVRQYQRQLVLPAAFIQRVERGERVEVEWTRTGGAGGTGAGGDYDRVRVAQAVYRVLAEVAIATLASPGSAPLQLTAERFDVIDKAPRNLTVAIEPAGKRREIPSGFQQSIPGSLVMFTLTILLTGGGVPLVTERRLGLLRRLASAPMSRGELVLGKALARLLLAAVQILFGVLLGAFVFGLDWGPDRAMLAVVLAAWGSLCAMLGVLVGNLAKNEGQAVGLGVAGSLVLAALGGCWWPIEITPPWMQQLAACLPTGWTMAAVHQLATFQNGAGAALQSLGLLLCATAIAGVAAARTFRYHG